MDGFQFLPRSVFLPTADALIVADLHVGRNEASDVAFPLGERRDLLDRLGALLARTEPTTVVFAGDVLHRFETVSERSRETVAELAAACREAGSDPVFVRGNHDPMLDAVRDDARDAYVVAADPRTVVCHGHEEPSPDAEQYVIGHDHPAIDIEGQRQPCFLDAPAAYEGADVLMLPAFSRLAAGVEINDARGSDLQSPLVRNLGDVRPILYDDGSEEALTFPPLASFRRLL
ncbi:metallophosphoesterase [Halobellus sp. Atlit-38R]|uniref:metallophosphoesterase n=1 Tax=Halobellus sp. Atlit-38R TaxID=2282131 RepID=UPI000EF26D6F|nr:metallophosphoesterase [Halobellus sp. Atlit-38R]RLM94549.1 metallophosphoesterase [Halobellus sp. Atlit-38R]